MQKEEGTKFNLEERTAKFGEDVVAFARKIEKDAVTQRLIPQLVAAGTSVGANYCEADCAESNKDFIHKMSIANKEIKETKYFLRIIGKACPQFIENARVLWKEANELNKIFFTIIKKSKDTEKKNKLDIE